jgi:hypothetical protein
MIETRADQNIKKETKWKYSGEKRSKHKYLPVVGRSEIVEVYGKCQASDAPSIQFVLQVIEFSLWGATSMANKPLSELHWQHLKDWLVSREAV